MRFTTLTDSVAEITRIAPTLGLSISSGQAQMLSQSTLRHNRFNAADLAHAQVSRRVTDLFRLLCSEAGSESDGRPFTEHSEATGVAGVLGLGELRGDASVGRFSYQAMKALQQRQ